ncbi:MAG: SWIM zinc finger family protein [Methanobacteriota archaeon]
MKGPIEDLTTVSLFDDRMRKKIVAYYKGRGKKALDIVDQSRVKRYRDFFVVSGDTAEYVVEDDYCSCEDYLHRGGSCAHILAVKIVRATGRYPLIDQWYYEDIRATSG